LKLILQNKHTIRWQFNKAGTLRLFALQKNTAAQRQENATWTIIVTMTIWPFLFTPPKHRPIQKLCLVNYLQESVDT
jgi:hypothetical protein